MASVSQPKIEHESLLLAALVEPLVVLLVVLVEPLVPLVELLVSLVEEPLAELLVPVAAEAVAVVPLSSPEDPTRRSTETARAADMVEDRLSVIMGRIQRAYLPRRRPSPRE